MPTYEYECTKCGKVTDIFQPITDKPLRRFRKSDDPNCECGVAVTRLLGRGAGIIFKGSGFYETDYRSDGYKKSADAEKKAAEPKKDSKESKGTKSETAKTETKKADASKAGDGKSDSGGGSKKSK